MTESFRSAGSRQILIFSPRLETTMEFTQSVGCITLARCPSFSFSFSLSTTLGRSAAGCLQGLRTTGLAVGSILMEYVPSMAPDAFSRPGCRSKSSLRSLSSWCTLKGLTGLAREYGVLFAVNEIELQP